MADDPALIMTVPLFIRFLEYAREEAEDDDDLHEIAERCMKKKKSVLTMADYEELVCE